MGIAAALVVAGWAGWEARAAGGSLGDQARSLLAQLAADESSRELVARATTRANDALSRASNPSVVGSPRGNLLEATALEWAQLARDLQRAREAERVSDRLEQEASTIQTEIVRSRAAVEQAVAQVGRARQELEDLGAGEPAAPESAAPTPPTGSP